MGVRTVLNPDLEFAPKVIDKITDFMDTDDTIARVMPKVLNRQGENPNMTKVAVLLAAYNGEKWITEQILTILSQKNVNLHIHVSIDLSTDNTYAIVAALAQKYPEIIILPYGQRFGGAAPNFYHLLLTVPVGKYEYIAFSDQDDIWLENKLERAIFVLRDKNVSGYSSNVTAFWENGKKKLIKKDYPQSKHDYMFESPGPGCTFVLKRELVLSIREYFKLYPCIGYLDWHDWVVYAYARANNYKWVIDAFSSIMYRQHSNNQLGVNAGIKAFINRMRSIISGHGINQSIKIIKFLHLENNRFVTTWLKSDMVNYALLAIQSNKCRRKTTDKIFFFFACIMMSIIKPKIIK
jgi:rhamnosyltransferase